ncbi:MAG: PAS domain-containing protein [Cytophagaceae bacterium]|nr:PAS domain-containing protein [Cytophagaceae bacterium]
MSQISPLPSLEAIFEAAPCGLLVCQAIRDASGRINDFRAIRAIAAVTRLLGFTQEVILGQTMLETQPNVKPTGLFDRYIAVTETGVPFEADVFLDDHWCNGSVVKLGDGFMITFVNVDETKAALRREAEVNAPPGCHGRCPGVPRVLRSGA